MGSRSPQSHLASTVSFLNPLSSIPEALIAATARSFISEGRVRGIPPQRSFGNGGRQFHWPSVSDGVKVRILLDQLSSALMLVDVGDHRLAISHEPEAYRSLEERLRESEERFGALFEEAPVACHEIDHQGGG